MLRVEWRRWQRETLTYCEMSKVNLRWPMVSRQSFTSLLLTIISVSFIFLFTLNTFNLYLGLLNTAQPGESRAHAYEESAASGESQASKEQASGKPQASASGVQVFELEQKKGKRFSWLQKLVQKFRRDKGHDGAWTLIGVEKMKLMTFGLLSESFENCFIAELPLKKTWWNT